MLNQNIIRVLSINLSTQEIAVKDRKDLFEYLGGIGVAAKLLDETVYYDKDALEPEQPLILATGAISTIYPVITKVAAVFKSPLTGELGESYAGLRL